MTWSSASLTEEHKEFSLPRGPATSLQQGAPLPKSSFAGVFEIWRKVKNDYFHKVGKGKFWKSTSIFFYAHLEICRRTKL